MSLSVVFSPEAQAHLDELEDFIADATASQLTAERYIRRIVKACLSLGTSPYRGTVRDELGAGLRTTGFERRATILFAVQEERVLIVGVFYGGRKFEAAP